MRFPIDTGRLRFRVAAPAEPVLVYDEGTPREALAPRTDENGDALWRVALLVDGVGSRGRVWVTVPGNPMVAAGERVTVAGLTGHTWHAARRSGMSLRARAITKSADRSAPESGR
jgi:hypothetical protein